MSASGPQSLPAAFHAAATGAGPRAGVRFLGFGAPDVVISYRRFLHMSAWLGRRVPRDPDGRPRTLIIIANDPMPTLLAFFAALWAGDRPVVLPGLKAAGGPGPLVDRVRQVAARFPGRCVLAVEEALLALDLDLPDAPVLPLPAAPDAYGALAEAPPPGDAGGGDVAFYQMTSASTGDAKVVAISHANACANLTALRSALGAGRDDRMATWLPLYHDMGLVGTVLLSFFHGWPLSLMKPSEFVMRPFRWLDAISRFRCTITAAPNFGYDYSARMVAERDLAGCDLSSLRSAVIGAEPIRFATVQGFHDRFGKYGLRDDALTCSYGMAESTLATTMAAPGSVPRYALVDPASTSPGSPVRLLGEGRAGPGAPAPERGVAVFSCGGPLSGIGMRLVSDGSAVHGEGVLGEVELHGPSVCLGYLDGATGEPAPFEEGRYRTGDLGFVHRGELFILERTKNVIIRNGQNYLASLLEDRVAAVLGHPAHETLVFERDIHDPTGAVAVLVENHRGEAGVSAEQAAALRALEVPLDELLFARKRVIPRTTSGKKRYQETRRLLSQQAMPLSGVIELGAAGES
ncbi:Acyl-CoA synthetase (AMP-forming)/AMP-acid ligase II [Sinosporangium album]|uniref:Acyl-CoA synthetase (AMP-forming)/AMP-acid ligase II n=1 Tax=Sinosporangium album TaxID=504805 RepID=A0A1G7SHK6_9ACTN|nr:AMP-binding protein [Sinosporangium album]SDG22468.1 Acyl-CoA synthetase (AMP-forming)/AMP-acid ligase II [Sinosporangium album]